KDKVFALNRRGTPEERQAFVDAYRAAHPESRLQFQLIRDEKILVPVIIKEKRPTTKLFAMVGPGADGKPSVYTLAPGRNMPRHPVPGQHTDKDGNFDEETFKESANAWFDTVMLTEPS
ncbi:hypothetical protein L0Y59_00440, partial [Candidatus Uhrbacteria bacterium]|nr:hypothetical protein [Candidatus Uhrbacteria bacterium]